MQGAAITDDAPLTVTEGATAQYVVTLSSAPKAAVVVSLSAPATVSVSRTSVTIDANALVSAPITVTAGHDRNVTSEKAVITATASGDENYRGATGSVAVMTADDDFSLTATPSSVTENTPFADASARLVTITVTAPAGGTASASPVQLGASGAGYTFQEYTEDDVNGHRKCPTPGHRKCPTSGEGGAEPCGGHEAVAPGGETSRAAPGRMALERSAWRRMR